MMKLQQAGYGSEPGRGVVLFGNHPETGKWFERWFETEGKARTYAAKRNWTIA